MKKTFITGLDVGSRTIRVVVSSFEHKSVLPRSSSEVIHPEIVAAITHPSRGIRRGYATDVESAAGAISEALAKAERECGSRLKQLYLGVGGIGLESTVVSSSVAIASGDREVTDQDVKRLITLCEENIKDKKNREILHSVPLIYRLDNKPIYGRPVGLHGSQLSVKTVYFSILDQHLEDLVAAVSRTGVSVLDVAANPLAASLATLIQAQKTAGCVLANIGAETVSVIVFEDNLPISLHVFPLGGNSITNDLALGLQIPLEEAEILKCAHERNANAQTKRRIDEIITARLRDIFELIDAHLRKLGKDGLLPAGIIITGGGAAIPGIELVAKSTLSLPARRLMELPNVQRQEISLSDEQNLRTTDRTRTLKTDPIFDIAYGLTCIGHIRGKEHEIMGMGRERSIGSNLMDWLKQFLP